MRKFLNDPKDVVRESLLGFAAAHSEILSYDPDQNIVVRVGAPIAGKVGVIAGGGSGHEPMDIGFVGRGMVDAACPGAVFTSPVPEQMVGACRAANGGEGVLMLIGNYTGDVMNFGLAAKDAEEEGIAVESVLISDDAAFEGSASGPGRRGMGATLLTKKLAGAMAARGANLAEVAALALRVNERSRSFGVALSSCIPPASGKPLIDLPDGQMEVGVGVHGERGRSREPLGSAHAIAALMVDTVLRELQPTAGGRVLVFLNGFGGTPQHELYLLYAEVEQKLLDAGCIPTRRLVGNFVTALEMAGAFLTVLDLDDELVDLWDAPVHTAALRWAA